MKKALVHHLPIDRLPLWRERMRKGRLLSFDLEVTARCNNHCRHCYISLPEQDPGARDNELSLSELQAIADEAVSLGAVWCLLTGGEPLLREDFPDLYVYLKQKGLLVTVFTNATLVTEDHGKLFRKFPPRMVEVTVYGVSRRTYEGVTRRSGSHDAFLRGLQILLDWGVRVRLKTMALRSNVHEIEEIGRFCRERAGSFRFDPFLHLRVDRDPLRNKEIESERLSPGEIVDVEGRDPERMETLWKLCDRLILRDMGELPAERVFRCGSGMDSITVGHDGTYRPCSSLCHPDFKGDSRKTSMEGFRRDVMSRIHQMTSERAEFREGCGSCPLINLCMWCPGNAHLETGRLDEPVPYFCRTARARAGLLPGDGVPSAFRGLAAPCPGLQAVLSMDSRGRSLLSKIDL